jgi:hypothetical protein
MTHRNARKVTRHVRTARRIRMIDVDTGIASGNTPAVSFAVFPDSPVPPQPEVGMAMALKQPGPAKPVLLSVKQR